jgi:anti-sigma-K factor RskA
MSEGPEPAAEDVLAAEHALGVLTAPERAAAEARMAGDPAFAAEVELWRERLSPLLAQIKDASPSPELWAQIERMLPANDTFEGLRQRARMWRSATAGSLALAAASIAAAIIIANRPPTVVETPAPVVAAAPAPLLNANLATTTGQPLFVAAYDPDRKALIVTSLVPPGTDPQHVHELWIIPADGKPHSLGMVEPGASKQMPMPDDMTPMMTEGGTLAVSVEPPGGSPDKTAPSGPVAATGKLTKI